MHGKMYVNEKEMVDSYLKILSWTFLEELREINWDSQFSVSETRYLLHITNEQTCSVMMQVIHRC
jgi:hypothetical protein